jgi:hypothetical protein
MENLRRWRSEPELQAMVQQQLIKAFELKRQVGRRRRPPQAPASGPLA